MANFLEDKRPEKIERAFLVGVQTKSMAAGEGAELLEELTELVENLKLTVVRTELVQLRVATPATLLGSGKTKELIDLAKAEGCHVIVFDEALTPAQQRNWEKLSELAVIDRQEVILQVFADRAQTREAVLQVALARMEYSLPRLTRAWSHLSRQRGSGGMGGEGETQLEQDRRLVNDRIVALKRELVDVRKQRSTQRQRRQRETVIRSCRRLYLGSAAEWRALQRRPGVQNRWLHDRLSHRSGD
jgi:GTP-binding protein HflX